MSIYWSKPTISMDWTVDKTANGRFFAALTFFKKILEISEIMLF